MNITRNTILTCKVEELVDWSIDEFFSPINNAVETVADMQQLYQDMQILANQYSYLESLSSFLKYQIRNAKREKMASTYTEDLIDKKEVISRAIDSVKLKHQTLSRMVTIRQEMQKEWEMEKVG